MPGEDIAFAGAQMEFHFVRCGKRLDSLGL
jgi:hypothetical protein